MINNSTNRLCGCKTSCGCGNDVIATSPTCDSPPNCFNPDTCSETFSTDCAVYTGDTIANIGLVKGMRLSEAIQLLVSVIVFPGCAYPTSPCLAVIGLKSTTITQTSATFAWNPVAGAINYHIEYRQPSSPTWIVGANTTNIFDSIGGLLPNTEYFVRVSTNCGAAFCYSLTLLITTKTN